MVLGYDVLGIPTSTKSGKSIQISAPLVLFDSRGAYIKHQEVFRLTNKNSLFQDYGNEIFETLEQDTKTLVIHKDGTFSDDELRRLSELEGTYNVETIPISINTDDVPRVFNPTYQYLEVALESGTCLPLSDKEFLMITTAIHTWVPERMGWPNPILITIHKDNLTLEKKLKLLYHIFALTKMQTGSQKPVRSPISIHYANMIDRFIKRVGDPNPDYLGSFIKRESEKGYLPRWFV